MYLNIQKEILYEEYSKKFYIIEYTLTDTPKDNFEKKSLEFVYVSENADSEIIYTFEDF
jgi:hypothetical protein